MASNLAYDRLYFFRPIAAPQATDCMTVLAASRKQNSSIDLTATIRLIVGLLIIWFNVTQLFSLTLIGSGGGKGLLKATSKATKTILFKILSGFNTLEPTL